MIYEWPCFSSMIVRVKRVRYFKYNSHMALLFKYDRSCKTRVLFLDVRQR